MSRCGYLNEMQKCRPFCEKSSGNRGSDEKVQFIFAIQPHFTISIYNNCIFAFQGPEKGPDTENKMHFCSWQLTIGAETAKIPVTRKVIIYKEKREP